MGESDPLECLSMVRCTVIINLVMLVVQVFMPVILGLSDAARNSSPLVDGCHVPVLLLAELCEVKQATGSLRPICLLVTHTPSLLIVYSL